jgi:hypothetical protein
MGHFQIATVVEYARHQPDCPMTPIEPIVPDDGLSASYQTLSWGSQTVIARDASEKTS